MAVKSKKKTGRVIVKGQMKKEEVVVRMPEALRKLLVPIESVLEWKANPRINNAAAKALATLIASHGWRSPLVAWSKNRVVYKGNTSLKAARILGLKEVPVLFEDFESIAAASAYGIADNKSSEYSDWDQSILSKLMLVKEIEPFVGTLGFSAKELRGSRWQEEEWEDMPEYLDNDLTKKYRKITVFLTDEEAAVAFAEVTGKKLTDKTKYIWYPVDPFDGQTPNSATWMEDTERKEQTNARKIAKIKRRA